MKKSLSDLVTELSQEDRAELLSALKAKLNGAEIKQLTADLETVTSLPERIAIKTRIQKLRSV